MTRKDRTEGIYSRREVLDESERRQYCLIQLKDLLSYAYRYSEDVKKRFDRAQFNVEKFKTLSDIKHIPILKKKELIFLQSMGPRLGGLLTKDIGDLKRIFLSPGPIFDPEDRGEDYWGYTEAFYSVGFRPGDAVQNTFNYQLTPAGLMFEEPLRNLGCAVIPAGPTDASTQLDIMQKLRVSGYVGTPSFLMHLAQKAEEKGLTYTDVVDQATALLEVKSGTADAAIIDSLMAGAMVGEGTGYDSLTYTVSLNAEEGEQYGVGFRQGSDLAGMLNSFFAASYADGSMLECAETYGIQAALIAQ